MYNVEDFISFKKAKIIKIWFSNIYFKNAESKVNKYNITKQPILNVQKI